MLEELELKKKAYQTAFIHNSMCTTTPRIEKMWNNPVVYHELYVVGGSELRMNPDMVKDTEHAMKVYKVRSEILQKVIKDIDWKIDFIKVKPLTWHKRITLKIKNFLNTNKEIISLESLKQ